MHGEFVKCTQTAATCIATCKERAPKALTASATVIQSVAQRRCSTKNDELFHKRATDRPSGTGICIVVNGTIVIAVDDGCISTKCYAVFKRSSSKSTVNSKQSNSIVIVIVFLILPLFARVRVSVVVIIGS